MQSFNHIPYVKKSCVRVNILHVYNESCACYRTYSCTVIMQWRRRTEDMIHCMQLVEHNNRMWSQSLPSISVQYEVYGLCIALPEYTMRWRFFIRSRRFSSSHWAIYWNCMQQAYCFQPYRCRRYSIPPVVQTWTFRTTKRQQWIFPCNLFRLHISIYIIIFMSLSIFVSAISGKVRSIPLPLGCSDKDASECKFVIFYWTFTSVILLRTRLFLLCENVMFLFNCRKWRALAPFKSSVHA